MSHASHVTTNERVHFTFNAAGLIYASGTLVISFLCYLGGAPGKVILAALVLPPLLVFFIRFLSSTDELINIKVPLMRCPTCGQNHRPDPASYPAFPGSTI